MSNCSSSHNLPKITLPSFSLWTCDPSCLVVHSLEGARYLLTTTKHCVSEKSKPDQLQALCKIACIHAVNFFRDVTLARPEHHASWEGSAAPLCGCAALLGNVCSSPPDPGFDVETERAILQSAEPGEDLKLHSELYSNCQKMFNKITLQITLS